MTLLCPTNDGTPNVTRLGDNLEAVKQGAHEETMLSLHSVMAETIIAKNGRALVPEILKREADRILSEKGATSKEYLHWQSTKGYLQTFVS